MVWYGMVWYGTILFCTINYIYSFSKKWWSHLRSCRWDHNADEDAIRKFFTWSKTEKLCEWPHDQTQFPAVGVMTSRLLYIRSLVHDVIKMEVHDRVCVCAPSAENFDNPYCISVWYVPYKLVFKTFILRLQDRGETKCWHLFFSALWSPCWH